MNTYAFRGVQVATKMRCTASAAMFCFASGCAGHVQPAALRVVPASQPASEPASQPETVTISRARFDAMAVAVIMHNRDLNDKTAGLQRDLRDSRDDDKATHAELADAQLKLKVWSIAGPIGTVLAGIGAALITHFAK